MTDARRKIPTDVEDGVAGDAGVETRERIDFLVCDEGWMTLSPWTGGPEGRLKLVIGRNDGITHVFVINTHTLALEGLPETGEEESHEI